MRGGLRPSAPSHGLPHLKDEKSTSPAGEGGEWEGEDQIQPGAWFLQVREAGGQLGDGASRDVLSGDCILLLGWGAAGDCHRNKTNK